MINTPGSLVKMRGRDWVVQPSDNPELVLLKPLGGGEDEIAGVFQPLHFARDQIESTSFPLPTVDDLGTFRSARTLYDATRLAFRNGAGPFRSMGKLSFRPRAYQMVPLIMALKQNPVRLLIADDVGIGKTIEALLIVKELIERREIKRFAIVCLPHLADQWQEELGSKFGIDAVIIRSNTQARLDREIHGDQSVFDYYPYQIISIDYIKADSRRRIFIHECPELVIVDEAHTAAKPEGAVKSQQQRYHLISDLASKPNQHIILLTATPHSGKQAEFQSLLGLINPHFESLSLPEASFEQRREVASHFIQRKRGDVVTWMSEKTIFPQRDQGEFKYELSNEYQLFFDEILKFANHLVKGDETHQGHQRIRYWTALGLLRGIISSPAAGIMMLENRASNLEDRDLDESNDENPILDEDYSGDSDFLPTHVPENNRWTRSQIQKLNGFSVQLASLGTLDKDNKAARTFQVIKQWLKEGYNPIIFCRYIPTAKYLGELLTDPIKQVFKHCDVQVITSEDPDEVRKQRVDNMKKESQRVLFATDCLSEGINLQEVFTAVLHYDLPWNPNRLEQREGRVDRFGQPHQSVKAYLLYGENNPIDGVVLRVILRKVREIRKSTGISIPFPEDSKSIMDTVLHAVLLNPETTKRQVQLGLEFKENETIQQNELAATREYDKAADLLKKTRSIFAHHAVKAQELENELRDADAVLGDPVTVEDFVISALSERFGVSCNKNRDSTYTINTTNLPSLFKALLPEHEIIRITFISPVPEGAHYIGRNHPFVEQLCQNTMSLAMRQNGENAVYRASVIRTSAVTEKTTLLLFRVRNVIEEKTGATQLVAEEMLLWGYRGDPRDENWLEQAECQKLLDSAKLGSQLPHVARETLLESGLEDLNELSETLDAIAEERARHLVEMHERYRKLVAGERYRVVKPVLPMDVLGIYTLMPEGS